MTRSRKLLGPLLLLAGACAVPTADRTLDSLEGIADRLVTRLELRSDPRNVRLLVYEFHESHLPADGLVAREEPTHNQAYQRVVRVPGHRARHANTLENLLQQEFVVHLTSRLNVIEAEHPLAPGQHADPDADLRAWAARHGANAIVVGDYVEAGLDVYVSVRIIDVGTTLVLAAARGVLDAASLETLTGHTALGSW